MISLTVLLCAAVVVLLILCAKPLIRHVSIMKHLHQLPGPPQKNFVEGNIHIFNGTPENIFKVTRKCSREYYPIFKVWTGYTGVVNIMNPQDFETILSNTKHNTKSKVYHLLQGWLGTGLLTSDGNKWQSRRKILTPSFHFNILQEFLKIFVEETDRLVATLKKECHKPYVDIYDYVSAFTLNTIGETAMGTNFVEETVTGIQYKTAIHEMGQIVLHRLFRPWLFSDLLYLLTPNSHKERRLVKTLHKFTEDVIAKREKNFKPVKLGDDPSSFTKRRRLAMLDLLLTAKSEEASIDHEGIREEVDTFMFEGHDTTAAALSFALMLLASHKEVQERVVQEMKEVLTPKIDYKSLQELKYMEMCIKEVLRLYPSVPFIARILGEDITTLSGHRLKAGTMVHMHIYDLHRNPDLYPEPERFNPDRFLPENSRIRHPFAYVPFSAGSRNCIGQRFAMLELKAALCGILSEFILEPVDTAESIVMIVDLVLRTREGIRVKFVPRTTKLWE